MSSPTDRLLIQQIRQGNQGSWQTLIRRYEGRLLALDTPGNLRSSLPGDVMEVIVRDRDRAMKVLERLPGIGDVQLFGERAHVRLESQSALGSPERLAALLQDNGVHAENVRRIPTSLEDVFIARVTS